MSRQDLLNALHALHHSRDGNLSKQASDWLEQWQYTIEAWSISDGILHESDSTLEIQHFCAQTLRTKVQRDFEELPAGAADSLRSSLLELLLHYGNVTIVRTQLCLAIAALVAHLPHERWGPGGSVQWLVQRLGMESGPSGLPCLLELLTVLPEEAGSYRPAVRPERRRQMSAEMEAAMPTAVKVLTTILQQHSGPEVGLRVLKAFSEWLKLGNPRSMDGRALAEHPLVTAALEGLGCPAEFDGAVDAVIELVYLSSSGGQPEEHMLPLVNRVVPAVMQLLPRFVRAAEQGRAAALGHHAADDEEEEDEETAKGIARLFAEVGEAYTALIATGSQEALQPLEALLAVASHPDNDLASMSFNFWHRLSRHLVSGFGPVPSTTDGNAGTAGSEDAQRRAAVFQPAFERLVALMSGRVRYPEDWDSWEEDDRDDFKHARQDVAETLVDAAALLGGERTLQLLTEPLAAMSAQVASGAAFDWRTAEAALYCVRAVHSKAPGAGDPLLLQLFGSLPQLPAAPPQLQYTAALALAAYSDWFAKTLEAGASADAGSLMPKLLEMLTTGLGKKEVASASALAMKQLCDACGPALAPYLDALMSLYQRIQSAGEASTSAGQSPSAPAHTLREADVHQVVQALALVVSALPAEQRKAGLAALMSPLVYALQQLLQQQPSRPNSATINGGGAAASNGISEQQHQQQQEQNPHMDLALPLIDRLTILFRHVSDPVAVAAALQQVWPLLQGVIDSFHGNTHAIERLSRCPRYALRTAGKAAAGLLPTLAVTLPHWFEATYHSSFLYVASELIKVFGSDPDKVQQLGSLFERLIGGCCLRLRSLADFRERPDMADDAFLLAGRGLAYCPSIVLTPAVLPRLIDCAVAGILVQHRDACCSILTFLTRLFEPQTLLSCGPAAATQITEAVAPRAEKMLRLLLSGAVGALPPPRCRDITDVLVALLEATHQEGLQWLTSAVDLIPDEAAAADDRKHLLAAAAALTGQNRNAAGTRALQDAVEEMSELVRRNRRSMDAAQRSLLAGILA